LEGLAGELKPKQREYLEDMREIGMNNFRLISDLLNVSKIERGVIAMDIKPVSLREIVELSVRDYEGPIRQKGLALELKGLEEPTQVRADRDKTVETLRNLVNNALKCTDRGSITLEAREDEDDAMIDVKDTGIGMDSETLGRLFTKQRMMGKEAGRSGAGLGLYIAKSFMEMQNGDITVASEKGKGSCFTLYLPKVHLEKAAAP
jgi:signal transduction histidine kinase